ncbi:MAG: hypothetical protein ACT443_05635 [Gemmatimonadota bacterium]
MIAIALALQIAAAMPEYGDSALRAMRAESAMEARDAFFGADKFQHAGMSYAVTSFAFAGTRNEAAAIATGAAAGILKEFYDRAQGRPFSALDLVWDAIGIALGFVMVKQT